MQGIHQCIQCILIILIQPIDSIDSEREGDHMYIQVNIGRNIDNEPMEVIKWGGFINDVKDAIYHSSESAGSIEVHHGTGVWDGHEEDSVHVSLLAYRLDTDLLENLLASLAQEYGQESIALIVSQSKLITAN